MCSIHWFPCLGLLPLCPHQVIDIHLLYLPQLKALHYTSSEKAVAPHSSTLAWKIPWTEETGGLQSMGWLRVRHDWAISLSLFSFMHWRRKWQPTPVFLPGESQGRGSLVGCRLWGRTESDTTEAINSSSSIILLSYFFGFRKRAEKWGVNSSSKRKQNTAGIFWGRIYESKARFQILKEAVLGPVTFLALTRLKYSTRLGASSATKVFIFPTHSSPLLCRRVWVLLQCRGEAERRNSSLFCPTKLVPQWIFSL